MCFEGVTVDILLISSVCVDTAKFHKRNFLKLFKYIKISYWKGIPPISIFMPIILLY